MGVAIEEGITLMKIMLSLAIASIVLAAPSFAQDQKSAPQTPQTEQGMRGMSGDMMSRMNKMMDHCEKMMSERHKQMPAQQKGG
jgi:hypothetical protein